MLECTTKNNLRSRKVKWIICSRNYSSWKISIWKKQKALLMMKNPTTFLTFFRKTKQNRKGWDLCSTFSSLLSIVSLANRSSNTSTTQSLSRKCFSKNSLNAWRMRKNRIKKRRNYFNFSVNRYTLPSL